MLFNSHDQKDKLNMDMDCIEKEYIIKYGEKRIYGRLFLPSEGKPRGAVILSHGFNSSCDSFENECRYFCGNGYAAYAFDFCGGSNMTRSGGKTTEMTVFTEREELIAVFDEISSEIHTDNMYLIGASQGGFVSALAAEELGDRVKAMALYFPAFVIPENWRENFKNEADIPEKFELWGVMLGKVYFTAVRDFYSFESLGKRYKNPLLIVSGDKDEVIPLSSVEYAANIAYQNGQLVIFKGEGHGFSAEKNREAMKLILDLINNTPKRN